MQYFYMLKIEINLSLCFKSEYIKVNTAALQEIQNERGSIIFLVPLFCDAEITTTEYFPETLI